MSESYAEEGKVQDIVTDLPIDLGASEARAKREGIKPAFLAKVEVLNEAIKDIGMGRFQYELFVTAGTSFLIPLQTRSSQRLGFGWFADNICACDPLLEQRRLLNGQPQGCKG